MLLFRILRDPDPEGGFGEAIKTALDEQAPPLETEKSVGDETEKSKDAPPAWDGKNERRKVYAGEKRRAADKVVDDPEHEMDFELEDGKGKAKFKTSELRENTKWLNENKKTLASMFRYRDMVTKHPEFGKVMNGVIEKSFNGENLNKEFVDKAILMLEGKADEVKDKIEEKDDLIDEMNSQLNDLDPESPQALILKKSIAYQKGLKAELKKQGSDAQKRIDALEAKLNTVDKKHTDFLSSQEKAETTVEVKRISEIYSKEIGTLTDKEKKDGYVFIDEDEQKEFDAAVRSGVAANSKTATDDASFVKLIHATAKAVYEKMSKRRESWVNDYIKKKGKPPLEKEKETPKKKTDEEEDPLKGKTIGQAIADEMFAG